MQQFSVRELLASRRAPLLVECRGGADDLAEIVAAEVAHLARLLLTHGALLFRGFAVRRVEDFDRVLSAFSMDRLGYVYGSSPRTVAGDRIFTSTEHPAPLPIEMHNECAYQRHWPLKLAFWCVQPATSGGETPLADMREVSRALGEEIIDRFASRGVRYVRHYHPHIDVPWQSVFQTDDRRVLAQRCEERGIEHCWLDDGVLRTTQVCQGVARHPVSGERVFFNQAHLFHLSSLEPQDRGVALALFGKERLPRQAYYGDGEEIPERDLDAIRAVFREQSVCFDWQAGDVLLLDNMQVAHGRRPFKGPRKILAALLEEYSETNRVT